MCISLVLFKPRHSIHNHVVQLLADGKARGTCSVERRSETRGMDWVGTGYYDDEYVREAGAWKFKARHYQAVTGTRPAADQAAAAPRATEAERRRIAEGWIRLARTRDPALLAELLAEDVVWTLPGASRMSGEARGREAVARRLETFAASGGHIELRHVLFGWDDVAVLLHNTGERDGRVLDEHLITLLRLRAGQIHRAETLVSDVAMLTRLLRLTPGPHRDLRLGLVGILRLFDAFPESRPRRDEPSRCPEPGNPRLT